MIAAATRMTLDNCPDRFRVELTGASVTCLRIALSRTKGEVLERIVDNRIQLAKADSAERARFLAALIDEDRSLLVDIDTARGQLNMLTRISDRRHAR